MATDDREPPLSKAAYVLQRIRKDIEKGHIGPGEPLRQADIAVRYGVSATPVREALRLLEADGIITYLPHKGAIVTELTPQAVVDLYRLRSEVEGLATELAVERISDSDIARIVEIHDRLAKSGGNVRATNLSDQNRAFHFAIYAGSSDLIVDYVKHIWTMLPSRVTLWQTSKTASAFIDDHAGIVEAIRNRDGQLARERMMAHILRASTFRQRQADVGS